ncbi:hypothetical protein GCM10027429_01310 [Marivirga atlantica]|jgi:hypothetical protein|uniref:Uncharacterized protein n=1 Tax=Marivirga atlantica TaxID=1548457 RepID=A0A937DFK0_9BACT|nr:hypothetical protein [Marivirga atlantica]MBL0763743.1 hypothetical protein [Marivirga atlantica]
MRKEIESYKKFRIIDGFLIINDNYKTQGWLLRIIFIVNTVNALLQLASRSFNFEEFLSYFWLIFGTLSLIALIANEFIRFPDGKIELDEIDMIKFKSGIRESHILKSKSGKSRSITLDKENYFQELSDLKEICKTYQIPIIE